MTHRPSPAARAEVERFIEECVVLTGGDPDRNWIKIPFPRNGWMSGTQLFAAYLWWRARRNYGVLDEYLPQPIVSQVLADTLPREEAKGWYLVRLRKGVGIFGQKMGRERKDPADDARVVAELVRLRAIRKKLMKQWRLLRLRKTLRGLKPRLPVRRMNVSMLPMKPTPPVDVDAVAAEAESLMGEIE